ncbi:hypothetical protein BLD44_028345 [Mastigocladus laminosus UU774]|nr:hypothetical protein BLD44_028345 [Mastigocladus laminosus UU774]
MSTNKVTVLIDAIDKLTPALKGITNSTNSLGAGAVFLGNLYTQAFNLAVSGVGKFVSAFGEAEKSQVSMMGLAGQLSAMTGKTYSQAKDMLAAMNLEFGKMAAALPGATNDYKQLGLAISDSLISANTINGKFNESEFQRQIMAMTKSLGVLKATSDDLLVSDVQLFFGKFVSGASESELSILKMAERMPGLIGQLQKASKEMYGEGKKFDELTQQQRAKIFEIAASRLVPDELIKDLETTASGQIEALKTSLFDQEQGIFGFLRDTDQAMKGTQSVLASTSKFVTSVLGSNGLLAQVGKLWDALKLPKLDPMRLLVKGIDQFTIWVNGLSSLVGQLTKTRQLPKFEFDIDDVLREVSRFFNRSIYSALRFLRGINFAELGANVATYLSDTLDQTFVYLQELVRQVDWFALGKVIGDLLGKMLNFVLTFVTTYDPDLTQVISTVISITLAIVKALAGMLTGLGQAIVREIGKVASRAIDEATAAARKMAGDIFGGLFNATSKSVTSNVSLPKLPNNNDGGVIVNNADGLNFASLMNAISREMSAMPSGAKVTVANDSETILNGKQRDTLLSTLKAKSIGTGQKQFTFNPTINIQGASVPDPNALADLLLRKLDEKFSEYQRTILA